MTTIRIPTGTITYGEAPSATSPALDHGYVAVQVQLSPEDEAALRRQQAALAAGYAPSVYMALEEAAAVQRVPFYEFRQQSVQANYVTLMPDGSLGTVTAAGIVYHDEPAKLGPAAEHTEVRPSFFSLAQSEYRRRQRANRKRRAARKRKRGWA